MTNYLMVNKFIMCFVLIAFTVGCTTMQPVPATDTQSLENQLEVGDKIKITRRDNSDVAFKVSAVSAEGISGDGVLVAYSDIQQVQVREFSTGKTVGLVAGVVGILAIIVGSTVESDLGIGANRD